MAALLARGVRFTNTHSLCPTFTTANASGMGTGHLLGDTGDFSNAIYAGFPVPRASASLTPILESDPVLGDVAPSPTWPACAPWSRPRRRTECAILMRPAIPTVLSA